MLSTRDLAEALGVSESSLKRWVDAGKIAASRTEGGHRRIALTEAMRFIRHRQTPLARPELLDLPEVAVARSRGADRLVTHLLVGDDIAARGWLVERYLAGASIAELADGPIRDAMTALGELWRHDPTGVAVEHRGTDACLQAVAQLRGMIPPPPASAPLALGGAPAGDPYLLPAQLAAMVALEAGMRVANLGPDTPATAFEHAALRDRPRLVWISVSTPLEPARARPLARWLAALPPAVAIVIGGREGHTLAGAPARARRVAAMADFAREVTSVVSC